MKKFLNKFSGKSSTVIWILASVCGILSFIYYLSTGTEIIVAFISAIVVLFLSMLAISVVAGVILGAIELIFSRKSHTVPDEQPNDSMQEERFDVVGTHYYLSNIAKLATSNPDWRKTGKALANQGYAGSRVYRFKYTNKPVILVRENDNPHDRNAVMVQIAGEKVGYISADEAPHVRDILTRHNVRFVSAFIGGGDYKEVFSDGSFQKYEDDPFIRVKIGYK